MPGSKQRQAPNSVCTAANRWRKAGREEMGSGLSHTMIQSQRVERKERVLPPVSWLCSVPVPEREGPGASADTSCRWKVDRLWEAPPLRTRWVKGLEAIRS